MESIKVRQRVGSDGMLHLDIPVELTDQEVEVMVIYQTTSSDATAVLPLADLYGSCADDPIEIDKAGILDVMDEDWTGAFD